MMQELADKNKILEIIVGSQLFGTATVTSDTDLSGIFIAPKEYYLGLNHVEQVDCSVVSKLDNGKNSEDAIDFTLYELRKFVKLCLDNNPNVLEQIFVPKNKVVFETSAGRKLRENKHLFPWKGASQKFLGYAYSQRHKMVIKTDNYTHLKALDDWIFSHVIEPNIATKYKDEWYSNQLLAEMRKLNLPFIKFHDSHAQVGDINISLTDKLSKVRNKVKHRLSKVGNREDLYTKYGYDVKFGMNLIRLMLEGRELLLTGNIEFPLKDRDLLSDIRQGKWDREKVIAYSEELENEIKSLEESTKLPSSPNFKDVEKLLISLVEEHWKPISTGYMTYYQKS